MGHYWNTRSVSVCRGFDSRISRDFFKSPVKYVICTMVCINMTKQQAVVIFSSVNTAFRRCRDRPDRISTGQFPQSRAAPGDRRNTRNAKTTF